ncbi:hypothetical protein GCM10022258_04910 [Aquimarina gracilis]
MVIRYSVDEIGEGPNLHMHPYDEIFHIIEGMLISVLYNCKSIYERFKTTESHLSRGQGTCTTVSTTGR